MLQREEPAPEKTAAGQPGPDVRDYLAEERTFLSWIRTILGMMGFGFAVARLSPRALWLGTALIAIGVVLSPVAVQRHRRMVEELNHPQPVERHPSRQGVILALLLAAAGIAMALDLILT